MNKENFLYKLTRNKSKLQLVISLFILLLVILLGVFLVHKNNFYKTFSSSASTKYVLAENIVGANNNGVVKLYNSKNGKVVDDLDLKGEYLIDMSDDFKELYMLNSSTGELFKITSHKNKIKKEKEEFVVKNAHLVSAFDYDNGYLVLLQKNKKSFLIKDKDSNTFKDFNPNVVDDIDLFRVVNNNLVFTSGEYICSKGLTTNMSNSDDIKVTQIALKLLDDDNIKGEVVAQIPAGEKVKIISTSETGWYLVEYNNIQGYLSNSSVNFKDSNTNDGGLVKIHIGAESKYIHESGKDLFVHNTFGADRGVSILLEVNPENLFIKNLTQFDNPTNSFISNINENKVYVNEISTTKDSKFRQIIKYGEFKKYDERLGFKYTSETVLDSENSYGMFGYVYYKDAKGVNVFNFKSQEKDLTIELDCDFFAPMY